MTADADLVAQFKEWQFDQITWRKTNRPKNVVERVTVVLDGVQSRFEKHPDADVVGYEGRLYQCWLFWQFTSACQGMHTPWGSVFVHGWRGLQHVLVVARLLRIPALEAKLEEVWEFLTTQIGEDDLDRFDALYQLPLRETGAKPLDEKTDAAKIKTIEKLIDTGFDKLVQSADCLGPKVICDDPEYAYTGNSIFVGLAQYVDALTDEHPEIVKDLGRVGQAPTPNFPTEPQDCHNIGGERNMLSFANAEMLEICTQNELWLTHHVDQGPLGPERQQWRIYPAFFLTKQGQALCLIRFGDGSLLIDVETWSEIGRSYYDLQSLRDPKLPKLLRMKDSPQFYVEREGFRIYYKALFKRIPKTLKYRDK